jgi:hypothetical protein
VRSRMSQFDIFRKEPGGGVLWRGTAASIAEAKATVEKMGASAPGEYLIVDLRTRSELTVRCDGARKPREPEELAS